MRARVAQVRSEETIPIVKSTNVEVDNLNVTVLAGPDRGLNVETEDECITIGTAHGNFLTLTDPTVSGFHLELRRGRDGVVVHDIGSTNGTLLGQARLSDAVVPDGSELQLGNTRLRVAFGRGAVVELLGNNRLEDLLGQTEVMRRVMARTARIAEAPVAVLIQGESGTGKELVARALHQLSPRRAGPLVTVDCGVLSPALMASELFGHERGSFTGAERQHVGAFERADGGTLFLDEIGELPTELQPQLLGALERQRFQRVGGRSDISVDVRVVAATHRDLRQEVNAGTFRMDLYYRLAVVSLTMPPLRERLEDLPLLIEHFLQCAGSTCTLQAVAPPEVLDRLARYRWPGNVRELRNWVEATLALGEVPELPAYDEPTAGDGPSELAALADSRMPYHPTRARVLAQFERAYCEALLSRCSGNVSRAAREAQMDRSYLIKLAQKHGLK